MPLDNITISSPATSTEPGSVPVYKWLGGQLARAGVTHVFFVDAILRKALVHMSDAGIKRVLAHTEQAAAYMADGYARIKKSPGICMAQAVGAANLASSLQDAWLAQTPVIAITGRRPSNWQHRNAYQEIEHKPLFAPVTKFSAQIDDAASFPRLLQQAWRVASTGTPRPVHLDLPGLQGEFIQDQDLERSFPLDPELNLLPPHRPTPSAQALKQAVERIKCAEKVVILAGTGAAMSGAGQEILDLARKLNAPVGTSHGARGIIPTRDPLSIGVLGSYAAPPANAIAFEADLALMVGFQAGDLSTYDWQIPSIGTKIIQIDIDPSEIGRNYPSTYGLMGDPKETLSCLIPLLNGVSKSADYALRSAETVRKWRASMEPLLSSNNVPIRPERLCAEISGILPDNAIVVADTGNSAVWTSQLIELNGLGQTYLRAGGSLGWALPAAIGAKCAAPDRPVICFAGDGAVYYHIAELETAKRRNIPFVLVVNNNSGLGQCYPGIQRAQADGPGDVNELFHFCDTDFTEIAKGFGVSSVRVDNPDDIGPALKSALAKNELVVIDVRTTLTEQPAPAWVPPAQSTGSYCDHL